VIKHDRGPKGKHVGRFPTTDSYKAVKRPRLNVHIRKISCTGIYTIRSDRLKGVRVVGTCRKRPLTQLATPPA
jgi:hypothetical protein